MNEKKTGYSTEDGSDRDSTAVPEQSVGRRVFPVYQDDMAQVGLSSFLSLPRAGAVSLLSDETVFAEW